MEKKKENKVKETKMKKQKVTYILFGVFLILVIGTITCGDSSDKKATLIPTVKPVEEVKEIVEEKVEEVKAEVEEKVEEVEEVIEEKIEEVKEVVKDIITIELPDLPKLEEIIPEVEEPVEEAPVEEAPVEEVEEEVTE